MYFKINIILFLFLILIYNCYGLKINNNVIGINIKDVDSIPIANPWVLKERIGLYNSVINGSKIKIFGDDNLNNPLEGFKIQLEWQNRTGRSEIQNNTLINKFAWWGSMNYYFSIIPYLSAMNNGLAPKVKLLDIGDNRYCTTYENCNTDLMKTWDTYFQYLIKIKDIPRGNDYDIQQQQLLTYMWDGHIASATHGYSIFKDRLLLLDPSEQKFASGWIHFVDIIAAINFNTNYSQILPIFEALPPRMLKKGDLPPFIPDFSKTANVFAVSLYAIDDLYQTPIAWDLFMSFLKSKTKNIQCRALINIELIKFTKSPTSTLLKLLIDLLINNCN